MNTIKRHVKRVIRCAVVGGVGIGISARAAEYTVAAGGDWEVPANWSSNAVPGGTDQIIISGSTVGKTVTLDSDSWQYLADNSLFHSTGEYRTYKLLLADSDTALLNVDIGDGHEWKATEGGTYYVGSASGSEGTLNVLSGSCVLEGSIMRIAESAGSTGLIYVTGENTYFSTARASGVTSMLVGGGGEGTFRMDGGTYESRMGVTVGASGTFEVLGSAVDSIGVGSRGSLDGNWLQQSGGTLRMGIDAGGVTPIFIDDYEDDGGGDVTFESGALLDVGFLDGAKNGSWDVMHWEGALVNNGLAFAPGVDAEFWSLSWVDTGSENGVDTLRVTYSSPLMTTNGTTYDWLDTYYPGLSSVSEYQTADDSDSDGDGLFTWQEYIAGTNPTNASSVLAMNSIEASNATTTVSWASVAGRRYGVKQCADLLDPIWAPAASNVEGQAVETFQLLDTPSTTQGFFNVFIEAMPNLIELNAEADTYVRDGAYANSNFGSTTEMKTIYSDDDQMELLVRFNLPSTTEIPDSATIWINTTASGTDPVENSAYLVEDNAWAEDSVTWNTKPVAGAEVDAWVTTNSRAIKIDVTDEITAALYDGGLFSILIKSPHNIGSDGQSVYASRENSVLSAPKLEIHFNEPKVTVQTGQSIQDALDAIHAQGGGHVILAQGNHTVSESLVMYSDITLRGQGAGLSSILLDSAANEAILIGTSEGSINSDITIKDLTLNGQQSLDEQHYDIDTDRDTVRGDSFGMLFTDQDSGNTFERIRLENIEVTRCAMGVHMKGVDDLRILNSDIHGNGCIIGYDHNTYFRRAENTLLRNLNISDCTAGNGFNLSTDCHNLIIDACDASDNNFRGIRFEANDGGSRLMIINCITSRNGLTEGQPGIRVANVPDFTILGCTANGNGGNGIYCVNSNDGLIKDNVATGNVSANYRIQGGSNITQINNQ